MQPAIIQGAGGGKGGGRAAVEAVDSLRSTQTAQILDLLSEGEIQGLVNGLKSVYLDGVPVQNADDSFNFDNIQFGFVPGTQGQAALPGITAVVNEIAVGVAVPFATPVVRTISNAAVDTVRVTIAVPQLTATDNSTGDLNGSEFEYVIEVQSASGGFVERARDAVKGKTTTTYKRGTKVQLSGAAPWDVRVRRITADSGSASIVNGFSWDSYTEIQSLKLRYPNSAIAALQVGAQQFNRIPVRGYDVLGLRVQVPANYNPLTRVYTGTWDGTFTVAWTDNPAWIFRELATNPRWGLGNYISAAQVNKWRLYSISQYNDAMVGDGYGGTEPRFRCGLVLQTREQARKVLQDLAAVFRAIAFWSGAELQAHQDAPSDPAMLFSPANVVDGDFSYQTASEMKRHSVFIVYYNDLQQMGKRVPEVYAPADLVARYGIRELELAPIGVWSRGQALRLARWAAYSEAMEGEVVSFKVGAEGALVMPGQVFQINDPNEAGERLGGRIHAATSSAVTLDAPVTLNPGESYTLLVQLQDSAPTSTPQYKTEERAVTTPAGLASVINVSPAFSVAPQPQATWLLQSDQIATTTWRCIGVTEVAGKDQFQVTGLAHDPGKYALIEEGLKLQPRNITRLRVIPLPPTGLATTETLFLSGGHERSRVTLSWLEPVRGLTYLVSWRLNSGAWVDLPATRANSAEIDNLPGGTLEMVVRSQNAFGKSSAGLNGTLVLSGTALDLVPGAATAIGSVYVASEPVLELSHLPDGFAWQTKLAAVTLTPKPGDAALVDVLVTASFKYSVSGSGGNTAYGTVGLHDATFSGWRNTDLADSGTPSGATQTGSKTLTHRFSTAGNVATEFALYGKKLNATDTVVVSDIDLRVEVIRA